MARTRCFFTKYGIQPDYKDVENIEKFLTSRRKIASRDKSGISAKNQRKLAKQIKYARFLALIPYTSYQELRLRNK